MPESVELNCSFRGLLFGAGKRSVLLAARPGGPRAVRVAWSSACVPPHAPSGTLPVLPKRLAYDVPPALRATHGWTQEKLEGLTVAGNGEVYAITGNDALDDAAGETVFLDPGTRRKVFGRG
ncbi:hypothetical protein [Streptomyces sp. NPDC006997]|uniref:hypothetical protein n=1 Tax=Streptomyces sp. NPDC006997 TaxID=3155356 RepID=UPI0033CBB377